MNEVEFKNWLARNNTNKKVQCDILSRIRRIEHEIKDCDIDSEYDKDKCVHLMSLFAHNGKNGELSKIKTSLPVGKPYMATYRHAVKRYVEFLESL